MAHFPPEQAALRDRVIGGSLIAAIIKDPTTGASCHPYKSELDAYREKVGLDVARDPDEQTAEMSWGNHVEAAIFGYLAESQKISLFEPGTLVHPKYGHVGATPDRIGRYPTGPTIWTCEAKNVGPWARKLWGKGDDDTSVPLGYAAQVIYEMGCVRAAYHDSPHADYGLLIAAIAGAPPKIFRIPWDEVTFHALAEKADRFWRDHIEPRREPNNWDSDAKASDFVAARWAKQNTDLLVEPTEADIRLAVRFEMLKRKEKEIEAELGQVGSLVRYRIGQNLGMGTPGKLLLTWKQSEVKESVETNWEPLARELLAAQTTDWRAVVADIAAAGWISAEHAEAADAIIKKHSGKSAEDVIKKHGRVVKTGGIRTLNRKPALAELADTFTAMEAINPPLTEAQIAQLPGSLAKEMALAKEMERLGDIPITTTTSATYVDGDGDRIVAATGEVLGKAMELPNPPVLVPEVVNEQPFTSAPAVMLKIVEREKEAIEKSQPACGADYVDRMSHPPEPKKCTTPGKEKYGGRCYKHRPRE